jgi:hypothetical protein
MEQTMTVAAVRKDPHRLTLTIEAEFATPSGLRRELAPGSRHVETINVSYEIAVRRLT